MSRPRFLADHDLNEHLIAGVVRREPSVHFCRARELGLAESLDNQVLQYAASEGFLVVSHVVNTMTAAAHKRVTLGQPMTGLLMAHQMDSIDSSIESLILIWSASEAEEWRDQICFLPL